jgi:endonuclease YncB( thermonuclease family)
MSIKLFNYRTTNMTAHDGDTVTCDIDLGFGVFLPKREFRLYGINAPELATDAGKIAAKQMQDWVAAGPIYINTIKSKKQQQDQQEKYGRWLGILFTADGVNLNQKMVDLGLAVPFMVGP